MSKRKRESAPDQPGSKAPAHRQKKRQKLEQEAKKKAAAATIPAASQHVTGVGSVTKSSSQPLSPELIAGLSKGQRKRLRRRLDKDLHSAAQALRNVSRQGADGVVQEGADGVVQEGGDGSRALKSHVDRLAVLKYATTSLVSRPTKVWHADPSTQHDRHVTAAAQAVDVIAKDAAEPNSQDETEKAIPKPPSPDKFSKAATHLVPRPTKVWHDIPSTSHPIEGDSPAVEDVVGATTSKVSPPTQICTSKETDGPSQPFTTQHGAAHQVNQSLALSTSSKISIDSISRPQPEQQRDPTMLLGLKQSSSRLRAAAPDIAVGRATAIRRVTRPSSYNDTGNAQEAYKRFMAFVESRQSGSEDEDDTSEGEVDSKLRSRSRMHPDVLDKIRERERGQAGVLANTLASNTSRFKVVNQEKQQAAHDLADSIKRARAQQQVSKPCNDVDEEKDGKREGKEDGQPDLVAGYVQPSHASESALDNISSVLPPSPRANVGIKRHSFLGLEGGGTTSASGSLPPPSSKPRIADRHADVFDVSELESTEALQALDEISEHLLSDTRPLPSKFAEVGDVEPIKGPEWLTTPSYRRSQRAGLKRGSSYCQHAGVPPNEVVDMICNSARVEGTMPILGGRAADDHVTLLASREHFGVGLAAPDCVDGVSRASTPLSELSRTPSPPDSKRWTDVGAESAAVHKPESQNEALDVPGQPTLRKRKMTGRTSKHFTPVKKSKRKVKQLQGNVDPDEEIPDRTETSRAEDAIRATFRAEQAIKELRPDASDEDISKPVRDVKDPGESMTEEEHGDAGRVTEDVTDPQQLDTPVSTPLKARKKRISTGKKSTYFTPPKPVLDTTYLDRVDLYNTTASGRKARVPAGVSIAPVPSIHEPFFGIIQEKLWREPFWLLIAVTFLNKTTGRAAVPVFWKLKEQYSTPQALADADEEVLMNEIWHLGLQRQRARRLIKMATAWAEQETEKGKRWRTLHYPLKGDGKCYKAEEVVEDDADECEGALEIGHIPGCGPYAWDSWRIFCRDVLRGVAEDYNGKGADEREDGEGFVPEWKKVLPLDKELRACLRWMWLRDGWIWDCENGEKREATEAEMELAVKGEMEIDDPQERKFAAQAAGVELSKSAVVLTATKADAPRAGTPAAEAQEGTTEVQEEAVEANEETIEADHEVPSKTPRRPRAPPKESRFAARRKIRRTSRPAKVEDSDTGSNIVVATPDTQDVRRSTRRKSAYTLD